MRESNHPKIMKVHELLEDTNFYYVVSEIIEGGSVINRMRQIGVPFTDQKAFLIVRQIMQALMYLHQKNIAHRDLKLENLIFTSKNIENLSVKLIDFGFACKFNRKEGM